MVFVLALKALTNPVFKLFFSLIILTILATDGVEDSLKTFCKCKYTQEPNTSQLLEKLLCTAPHVDTGLAQRSFSPRVHTVMLRRRFDASL